MGLYYPAGAYHVTVRRDRTLRAALVLLPHAGKDPARSGSAASVLMRKKTTRCGCGFRLRLRWPYGRGTAASDRQVADLRARPPDGPLSRTSSSRTRGSI